MGKRRNKKRNNNPETNPNGENEPLLDNADIDVDGENKKNQRAGTRDQGFRQPERKNSHPTGEENLFAGVDIDVDEETGEPGYYHGDSSYNEDRKDIEMDTDEIINRQKGFTGVPRNLDDATDIEDVGDPLTDLEDPGEIISQKQEFVESRSIENDTDLAEIADQENETADPYTGERLPDAPSNDPALSPVEIESFADLSEELPFDEETATDFALINTENNADAVVDEMAEYTDDSDILDDFAERQGLVSQSEELQENLLDQTDQGPGLSAGDVDAAWDQADQSGEEATGGSVPTPDQDIVDEVGEALGMVYQDGEELHTDEKWEERDRRRWELDPKSKEDSEETEQEDMDLDDF